MEVISTRRYEVRPPADSHASILVDPANAVATVKEEEWETRKKKEITTTRQIETRVKRQVVLEDGEVVVDSGPQVTTNTTEDVEQQEHTTQERRTTGDEPQKVDWPAGAKAGALVQKELNETIVKSREEVEELLETEDRQHLGDLSDEAYLQAVRNNRGDLRVAIAESKRQLSQQQQHQGPRVVQHTTRSNKVVDTEKTLERSELKKDGQIVTERKTTVEHEEIKDDPIPEEIDANHKTHHARDEVDEAREIRKEATQRYSKTRDEDIVDYVQNGERIAREMRFVSETTEAERTGDWPNDDSLPGLRSGSRLNKHEKQNSSHIRAKSPPQQQQQQHYNVEPTSSSTRETSSRVNGHHSPATPTTTNHHHVVEHNNNINNSHNSSKNNKESSYSRTYESSRRHQERYSPPVERPKADPPSPPIRRKAGAAREQIISTKTERNYHRESTPPVRPPSVERSPVHVVQRTWESRRRDEREESRGRAVTNGRSSSEHVTARRHETSPERTRSRPRSPDSRSVSPSPARRDRREKEERSRTSKSPSPSKSKFSESFRKLVGKLRSASSERGKKRPGSSSTSQLTQTDDSSTYLQYNSVDRNIPLGPDYDETDRPPERPPRSPRNNLVTTTLTMNVNQPSRESSKHVTSSSSSSQQAKYKSSRAASPRHQEYREHTTSHVNTQKNDQPIHRYYLGEDPYGGSIYGKEKGYRETKIHSRHRRPVDEYSNESSTLGRYSKSTSRLQQHQQHSSSNNVKDYDRTDYQRHRDYHHNGMHSDSPPRIISSQTLPRKMHHLSTSNSSESMSRHHKQHTSTTTTTTKRYTNGHNTSSSPISRLNTYNSINSSNYHNNNNNNNINEPSRQYGSMINISFKNQVSPPKTTHYAQTFINTQPPKPERTYKSTLSRSKSFNVEIADDGVVTTPRSNGYSSNYSNNIRSSTHLNKLDETPPLKSPGILASISRSNRDLMRNGKSDY